MEKLPALLLVLASVCGTACGTAWAQTPATNPMPDGSDDMYVGLGVASAPTYAGSARRRDAALPVLQVEWSNGMFVSGMSAGWHLSRQPSIEFGPLLAIQPRRAESGVGNTLGGVSGGTPALVAAQANGERRANPLTGLEDIQARLLAGGFLNYYLTAQQRLTAELLYGAGNARHGARARLGLQRIAGEIAPHHSLALTAGLTLVNRDDNQAFFGIDEAAAARARLPAYRAGGGVRDVYLGARWNWALTPAWMLSSGLQAARLRGSAAASPLVERPTSVTVSSALAYRF